MRSWSFSRSIRRTSFPGGASDKEPASDAGSIPGLGRCPGGEHAIPLQCSCLENPMDRGAWQAMVHEVTKSQTKLQRLSTHIHVGRQRITEAVGPKSGHQPSSAQNSSEALASLPPTAHKASSHASDSPPHCLALCTPCQPHRLPGAPGTQPAHVDHRPLHWLLPLPQMLSADSHGRSLHRLGVFPRRPSALEGRSDLRIVAAALTPAPPDTPWAPHAALVFISLRPPLSCSGASLTCPVRLLSVSPLRAVAAGGSLHLEVVWRIQSVLNA